ncbi:MAG: hypothetical protein A3I83_01610 [Methylotenera sp. RIFCSPLOWO2_02_FULL_45_14]|nr:MAG: hypothetical protein A3I83_01610 [Methylotenera sp. RIFCSPLOWO2_02_FULL_45_14]
MNTLNPWRVGSAIALTAAIVNVICAVAVYLFPDGTISFINSWTHGLDLTVLRNNKPWTVDSMANGLFNVTLIGFLFGALFACCYNLVGKCRCCR